ncbi:hypothetical protein D3C81_1494150 [compost metagenome]
MNPHHAVDPGRGHATLGEDGLDFEEGARVHFITTKDLWLQGSQQAGGLQLDDALHWHFQVLVGLRRACLECRHQATCTFKQITFVLVLFSHAVHHSILPISLRHCASCDGSSDRASNHSSSMRTRGERDFSGWVYIRCCGNGDLRFRFYSGSLLKEPKSNQKFSCPTTRCRALARHRTKGARALGYLGPGGVPLFQVTRRKGGTLRGRYRRNGYVHQQKTRRPTHSHREQARSLSFCVFS